MRNAVEARHSRANLPIFSIPMSPKTVTLQTEAKTSPRPDAERREQLIDDLVRRAARMNVTAPAILFLEMNRPLAFVGAQVLWTAQPFLSLWLDPTGIGDVARLLEDPASVDELIHRLESA
ncbi:MAG: hypothetical protein ACM3S0_14580 [Acidobacteriota bacterium]|jgi:hypothetical protein